MTQKLYMDGLTVWFDPKGGKEKTFGIHVPGGSLAGLGPRPPFEAGTTPPTGREPRAGHTQLHAPPIEPLKQVAITYAETTGPLTMEMAEVRRTGIDIGIGQHPDPALVFEFSIAFRWKTRQRMRVVAGSIGQRREKVIYQVSRTMVMPPSTIDERFDHVLLCRCRAAFSTMAGLLLIMAGCAMVGPDYAPPEIPLPDGWNSLARNASTGPVQRQEKWW